MCDKTCLNAEKIPFTKKQAETTRLCGQECTGQNLEIDCIRSNKVITQNIQTNLLCTNKIKLTNVNILDSTIDGTDPITINTNTIGTTSSGTDLTLILDPATPNGCLVYVGHTSGSDGILFVEGLGGPNDSPPFLESVSVFSWDICMFLEIAGLLVLFCSYGYIKL